MRALPSALVGPAGLAGLIAAAAALVGCQGDPPPPPPAIALASAPPEAAAVMAAGTGAMTPLCSRLASAWAARGEGLPVVVEPSLGSGGGVKATAEGAVDLGLVSRPLGEAEMALGLEVVPLARGAVVIAANPSVAVAGLSLEELEALHAGRATRFSDGMRAVVLLRDREESANAALDRLLPSLKGLREQAYASRRFRVLYHDDAMLEALATTPGAIGVADRGAVTERAGRLKVLELGGVFPSAEAVADGRWKATRDLSFVYRRDRAERVRPFLAFAASAEGQAIVRASGMAPIPRGSTP